MKSSARRLLFLALFCSVAFAQGPGDDFRSLQVDASKVIGEIHSFQGLNGPPTPVMAGLPDLVERYKELRVGPGSYARFHGTVRNRFEIRSR
jgi:hypothetical protein